MIILGAGMAGCLMGAINNNAEIFEAQNTIPDNHHAVLRFRDDKISKTTGIPFRKVKVQKSIWFDGKEVKPSPRFSNMYSNKVTGKLSERSIDDISPVYRYIAPSDFHIILADICVSRIRLGCKIHKINEHSIYIVDDTIGAIMPIDRKNKPIISTMPMKILSKAIGIDIDQKFSFKKIFVSRYSVKDCDVFQTVYYPDERFPVYRATLTGSDLIIESTEEVQHNDKFSVMESLGINPLMTEVDLVKESHQQYGKISPIEDSARKNFMFNATYKYAVYSLGRFACWRNILLDDVYEDIFKIKQMINQDHYDIKVKSQ